VVSVLHWLIVQLESKARAQEDLPALLRIGDHQLDQLVCGKHLGTEPALEELERRSSMRSMMPKERRSIGMISSRCGLDTQGDHGNKLVGADQARFDAVRESRMMMIFS
jgi:hypothetical protein